MTREEAKDILEWGRPFDGDHPDRLDEFKAALSVAIEALEQESVIDKVLVIIDTELNMIRRDETGIPTESERIVSKIKNAVLILKGGEQG